MQAYAEDDYGSNASIASKINFMMKAEYAHTHAADGGCHGVLTERARFALTQLRGFAVGPASAVPRKFASGDKVSVAPHAGFARRRARRGWFRALVATLIAVSENVCHQGSYELKICTACTCTFTATAALVFKPRQYASH